MTKSNDRLTAEDCIRMAKFSSLMAGKCDAQEMPRIWTYDSINKQLDAELKMWKSYFLLDAALDGEKPRQSIPANEVDDWKKIGHSINGRTPAQLAIHALSHYYRAYWRMGGYSDKSDEYILFPKEKYPQGCTFKVYLSMWITAIGIPQLHMTDEKVKELCEFAEVSPVSSPLLPEGRSYFDPPKR